MHALQCSLSATQAKTEEACLYAGAAKAAALQLQERSNCSSAATGQLSQERSIQIAYLWFDVRERVKEIAGHLVEVLARCDWHKVRLACLREARLMRLGCRCDEALVNEVLMNR